MPTIFIPVPMRIVQMVHLGPRARRGAADPCQKVGYVFLTHEGVSIDTQAFERPRIANAMAMR